MKGNDHDGSETCPACTRATENRKRIADLLNQKICEFVDCLWPAVCMLWDEENLMYLCPFHGLYLIKSAAETQKFMVIPPLPGEHPKGS